MRLDQQLSEAAADLRSQLDQVDPPEFRPTRPKAPLALALVLLLGLGIISIAARSGADEQGSISVATQPEAPDTPDQPANPVPTTGPTTTVDEPDAPPASTPVAERAAPVAAPRPTTVAVASPVATASAAPSGSVTVSSPPLAGQLTAAGPGEFIVPLSFEGAWNADESRMVLYRTGATAGGANHAVVDTATGAVVTELPINPPDIEQVYWHPQDADVVLFAEGANLMAYSVATSTESVVREFTGCDRVDSGILPVSPSISGTISLLCHAGDATDQLTYDLATGAEVRVPTTSTSAAMPSPSGRWLVRANSDGSATVLDASLAETGVVLDLDANQVSFVTTADRREWAAATLFEGEAVGSLVLLPLDGASRPVVVIGPDAGDAYPPSGTKISATGSVVALSISGADDGQLAGRILVVDIAVPALPVVRTSVPHQNAGGHDYWSSSLLALSPTGQHVAYVSDEGGDRVNTFIAPANF